MVKTQSILQVLIMKNKATEVLLISDSRLLIDGLRKILELEESIVVIADFSDIDELGVFLKENEPDYIFFDQRLGDPQIEKLLFSEKIKAKTTQVIFLSNEDENDNSPGGFITVNQNTGAAELIDIIMNRREFHEESIMKNAIIKEDQTNITKSESRIINLVTLGRTNKEIAENLRVSEKTIKAHVTSIFTKLNIQNRYQLMVYGKRSMKRM